MSGAWGIGKTHAWQQLLTESHLAGTFPVESYAYVSLFGVNSLVGLQQAILANTVQKADIGQDASLDTLGRFLKSPVEASLHGWKAVKASPLGALRNLFRRGTLLTSNFGIVSRFVGDTSAMLFLSVRNRVICFDDLERRGKGLSVHDVLGLASMLKEQRGCKIVFLLNDQAMKEDEQTEFRMHLEKVVDTFFRFMPAPQESADIAFPAPSPVMVKVSENCVKLRLTNIRILDRIRRFVDDIAPVLDQLDPSILNQAVSTVVLLCWVTFDPSKAPTVKHLSERNLFAVYNRTDRFQMSTQAVEWEALLQSYDFGHLDDLDRSLLQGIQDGAFDKPKVVKIASDMNSAAIRRAKEIAFRDAWGIFHASFDDDQEAVLDMIERSYYQNYMHVAPTSLSYTVEVFKSLGRSAAAADILKHYVDHHEGPAVFDIASNHFSSEIRDPDVIAAFHAKHLASALIVDPRDALKDLAERNRYDPDCLRAIMNLSPEDFRTLFKELRGTERDQVIEWCMSTGSIGGDTQMNASLRSIYDKANQALTHIGKESKINCIRAIRFLKREVDA